MMTNFRQTEAVALVTEARTTLCKRPDHARILATWAGILARDIGMADTDNPFPADSVLHRPWAIGFAMRRQAPIPRASQPSIPLPRRTFASISHDRMDDANAVRAEDRHV